MSLPRLPGIAASGRVAILVRREVIGMEAWNAEASPQVKQIQRAERSIHHDQIQVCRLLHEDGHAFDGAVLKANPKIGPFRLHKVMIGLRDQVLPAMLAILRGDRVQGRRVVHPRLGIVVDVHSDGAQTGDDMLVLAIAGNRAQAAQGFGAKREVCVEAGILSESKHRIRNPVVAGRRSLSARH